MAVPPHLYSYPLYVYRMLVQLFLADLRVLEDGTGVRDDLRALHDYYTDVRRTAADYPEEWLRTLPARVRGQVVECFARVADAHLVNVVTQYGHDDDFALGVARRTAWQAVRDQRGARPRAARRGCRRQSCAGGTPGCPSSPAAGRRARGAASR